MPKDPQYARSQATELRFLYVLVFLFIGGFGNYGALWLDSEGWGESAIGWLNGIGVACMIVFAPLWGWLADRKARPVRTLGLITLGSAVGFVPFVLTTAVVPLLVAMTVFSFFRVGVIPSTDSLALGHLDTRGGDYGRIRLFGSLGFIIGGFGLGW